MSLRLCSVCLRTALAVALSAPLGFAQTSSNWADVDIGAVGAVGSAQTGSGTVTLRGAGEDIWGRADEFHFRYVPWTGDGQFIVRVTGVSATDPWAKAGIMIRGDLSPGAAHAFASVNPQKIISLLSRSASGGDTSANSALNNWQLFLPVWLKLTRQGDRIALQFSGDNVTWQALGSVTVALPSAVYVGLAVTSHVDATLCTATFESFVQRRMDVLAPPSGLRVDALLPSHMQLSWINNAPVAYGFNIERSIDGLNFAQIAFVSGSTTSYADTAMVGTAAPITYSYRVQAVSSSDASVYSAPASAVYPNGGPGFTRRDIGTLSRAGSAMYDGTYGVYAFTSAGADFYGTADSGSGYLEPWQGDGDIIARVTSLDETDPWAKAGLMVRESNWSGARSVGLFVSARHGVVLESRAQTDGDTALIAGTTATAGSIWLRLSRRGHGFTAWESWDGIGWALVGSVTVEMNPVVQLGLAVTAHNNSGVLCTARFDNLQLAPVASSFPIITAQPASRSVTWDDTVAFTANATPTPYTSSVGYQWYFNGQAIAGSTGPTLSLAHLNPGAAGLYTVAASSAQRVMSQPAILGFASTTKIADFGQEVAANLQHPNGNIYDQVLMTGHVTTVMADPGQVTRISFVDLTDDIVQVEFAGPGALTLSLAPATGPAPPVKYNQPDVAYVRGHASIIITGANETTNVSVFSVGRANAVNQSLFRDDVVYDGVADIAYIAILSANGRFGGIRAANASFNARQGNTGVYAPGVTFTGPIWVGDINAFESAEPVLVVGNADDVRITGGGLGQLNHRAVRVNGFAHLQFTAGSTSQGTLLPAQSNQARLERDSVDVTAELTQTP